MLKADAFKNYVCQELSFAEFSGRRTSKLSFAEFRIHIPLRYAPLLLPLKLSEAEFSEYPQPNNAARIF